MTFKKYVVRARHPLIRDNARQILNDKLKKKNNAPSQRSPKSTTAPRMLTGRAIQGNYLKTSFGNAFA